MTAQKPVFLESAAPCGWVLYDGECAMCKRMIDQFSFFWIHCRYEPVPLQTPWVREKLGFTTDEHREELLREMRVLTSKGQLYGGADAILFLTKQVWWGYPFYLLGSLPGVKWMLKRAYEWVAKRRHCNARGCSINHRQ